MPPQILSFLLLSSSHCGSRPGEAETHLPPAVLCLSSRSPADTCISSSSSSSSSAAAWPLSQPLSPLGCQGTHSSLASPLVSPRCASSAAPHHRRPRQRPCRPRDRTPHGFSCVPSQPGLPPDPGGGGGEPIKELRADWCVPEPRDVDLCLLPPLRTHVCHVPAVCVRPLNECCAHPVLS